LSAGLNGSPLHLRRKLRRNSPRTNASVAGDVFSCRVDELDWKATTWAREAGVRPDVALNYLAGKTKPYSLNRERLEEALATAPSTVGKSRIFFSRSRYIPAFSPLEKGEVSAEGVADALEALYRDPARARELARAAATENPAHSWDAIAAQFDDLITALARDGNAVEAPDVSPPPLPPSR
jgi:hypothetical protein